MRIALTALTLCIALVSTSVNAQDATSRRLSRATLEDKIRGGWAGQMIGVSYGAPTEFRSNGKIIEGNLNKYLDWSPARLKNAIDQDDLYVEMTFAEVMDKVGLDATTEQYGEMFKNSQYELWHANAGARRNLNRGIKAPMSGNPKYNVHANDIDFQIESDFIGMMTPGLPREANKYADRVGRVMNWATGCTAACSSPACTPPRFSKMTRARSSSGAFCPSLPKALTQKLSATSSVGRLRTPTTG